jgi:hypothetical protein
MIKKLKEKGLVFPEDMKVSQRDLDAPTFEELFTNN